MHRRQPARLQIFENFHRFIRSHVNVPERFRMVSSDREQSDFRRALPANIFEPLKIGAVPRVINSPPLMFEHKSPVAPMMIAQHSRPPMFAWRQRHFPIPMRKTVPPFQLDHSPKTQVVRQITHPPRHHPNFRMGQTAQRWLVKMVEMRVRQQHQIDPRQMLDSQAGAFDPLQQEKPVGKIGIDQNIQVSELDQKRRMANPGDRHLAGNEFGK